MLTSRGIITTIGITTDNIKTTKFKRCFLLNQATQSTKSPLSNARGKSAYRINWRRIAGGCRIDTCNTEHIMTYLGELIAKVARACVHPHNGIVVRFAGSFVPNHGGFALVGNTHSRQVITSQTCLCQSYTYHLPGIRVDLVGVMLNPALLLVMLFVFHLMHGHQVAVMVEDDKTSTCCTLIN
jgi:hypothetical protein